MAIAASPPLRLLRQRPCRPSRSPAAPSPSNQIRRIQRSGGVLADWLPLPAIHHGEQKLVGLFPVYPGGGEGDGGEPQPKPRPQRELGHQRPECQRLSAGDHQAQALAEAAARLQVSQADLAAAAVRDRIAQPAEDFNAAAQRVLSKNAELVRRLA